MWVIDKSLGLSLVRCFIINIWSGIFWNKYFCIQCKQVFLLKITHLEHSFNNDYTKVYFYSLQSSIQSVHNFPIFQKVLFDHINCHWSTILKYRFREVQFTIIWKYVVCGLFYDDVTFEKIYAFTNSLSW